MVHGSYAGPEAPFLAIPFESEPGPTVLTESRHNDYEGEQQNALVFGPP